MNANALGTFPSTDQVVGMTVYNIGGSNDRLISAIHYNYRKIYIRHVLTHADYNRDSSKSG